MGKKIENQIRFLEVFKDKLWNISATCKELDMDRSTYYKWLEDEEFEGKVKNAKEDLIDFAENALLKQIKEGVTTSIIFFLKTQAKHRGYIERQELTGADGDKLETGVVILPEVKK
jgi:hypothetical protein